MTDDEIALHRVEMDVCDLCLAGAGGECHVPGCAYWMNAAPTGEALTWIQWRREVTAMLEDDAADDLSGTETNS